MKMTLGELRKIIREQVGTMVYVHNAGFGGMGGVSALKRHKDVPPPGLGDEGDEEQETHGEEQEKPQWTVRVRDRAPRT
jgi:hypothetical protein